MAQQCGSFTAYRAGTCRARRALTHDALSVPAGKVN